MGQIPFVAGAGAAIAASWSISSCAALTMARDRQKISPVVQFARRKIGTKITSFCMNMKT
jgi:hypothetical protein